MQKLLDREHHIPSEQANYCLWIIPSGRTRGIRADRICRTVKNSTPRALKRQSECDVASVALNERREAAESVPFNEPPKGVECPHIFKEYD
jgi:hypothetical protein